MKNVAKKAIAAMLALLLCFGVVACEGKGSEGGGEGVPGENGYVHISAVRLGYGVDWLYALEDAFEEKTGINVYIDVAIGSAGQGTLDTELESLASTTDLFFNKRGWFAEDVYKGSISARGQSYPCLYENLDDVWSAVVDEGASEEDTIESKMDPIYAEAFNIEGHYYSMPWAGGVYGIVRNLDVWNSLHLSDEDVPYTTNELFALCDRVKGDVAPFIYSLSEEYYTGWSPIFFGQYDGKENVERFMSGRDPDNEVSEFVYTYPGQLKAMQFLEELLDPANGYQHKDSQSLDFTTAQGYFLLGQALFMVNGAWLENEMKQNFPDTNIDMIKTPVLSSIVEKLSFGSTLSADEADKKLIECIQYVDAVDAGETPQMPSGVTEADIEAVTEARHYSYMAGGIDHQAYIPAYSSHIREAKEFLKFMYSDEGMQIYYETLNGAMLPATLTSGTYSDEVSLSNFRKSVNEAQLEGYVYDREPKARYYVLAQVSTCFENNIDPIVALAVDGKDAEYVIAQNSAAILVKWPSIQQLLGLA